LPECLALTDAAATVNSLRDGHSDPLGGYQKRRQHRSGLLRPVLQSRDRRAPPVQ